jgi:hypothetical protein
MTSRHFAGEAEPRVAPEIVGEKLAESLTNRELLDMLTRRVRLLAEREVGEQGRRRLMTLQSEGWVEEIRVRSPPLPKLEEPLGYWTPGRAKLDFGRIAYRARTRWHGPARSIRAFVATVKAGDLFGGRGGPLRNPLAAAHDLACVQLYLMFRMSSPQLARSWIGEDAMAQIVRVRRRDRLPDAVILGQDERPALAIELVGASYSKRRIAGFHAHCAAKNLPYMLW